MVSDQLKSMTAYGRGTAVFSYGRLSVEIQSVNRRFLEMNFSLPRLFMRYEMDIRKQIGEHIARGMLNVALVWKSEGSQPISVMPNMELAHNLKAAWEILAHKLNIQTDLPLALLIQEKELFLHEEEIVNEEIYRNAIRVAVNEALDALLLMKQQEGAIVAKDLRKRLDLLRELIAHIETASTGASEKYRQKLQDRLKELVSGSPENEERLLREIAMYAERVDTTEEVVRFKGHITQFENLINKISENELETRGKTLDFLLQELLREINTIGSKASDLSIAQNVVSIKSELEKIREQVQNIE